MSDIQLDLAGLRTARGRVAGALTTFQSADRVGDDLADLTGEHRLAGKVRDFAGNWDHNRGKLEEQLVAVRDWLDAIVETMTDLDRALGESVSAEEGTP
ncbi:hypothetical protein [Microbacterium sp. CFBP9034]|uniref:hypothetical protein n=1 Tax=Microbacterium sp. CFBP9034 TaxID=3096540 RepID=UPI002A6A2872|nr:hypothetical protein [Microbacterium sp. CFBP9034]MDY0907953.1 hypothetical protein [Microbacterium sp. CFBP9034]